MLRAIHGLLVAASALTLATSCKPRERTTDAEVKNITIAEAFGFKDYGGLTVYLPGESITVCLQGISTTSQYAALIKDGIMVGSSRVDLQACKLEYSIVSPK